MCEMWLIPQSRQVMHEWPSPCKAKLPIFKVTGNAKSKIIILRCFQRVLTQPKHGYNLKVKWLFVQLVKKHADQINELVVYVELNILPLSVQGMVLKLQIPHQTWVQETCMLSNQNTVPIDRSLHQLPFYYLRK